MKRRGLIAELERLGCVLLRNGAKHDIYHNLKSGKSEPCQGIVM
jgi:mRNA interferase HicA